MPIMFQKWITRQDVRSNPDRIYVFGDNMRRQGLGGQAKQMRGEPNATGVVTKHKPTMDIDAFFRDSDKGAFMRTLVGDLTAVEAILRSGTTVVWPADGIGSGLSRLQQYAPQTAAFIEERLRYFINKYGEVK